ncbi:hypothetical protein [Vibrio mimicus]|uniref:hypothetical protein n=1 Tax=Vibrio mimicus TaxID=674 RepID=UPI0008787C90|nr:hypothetical protein [Vibrio mimicus]AOW81414.1 hypothetical protein VM_01050 [Vibrio mimicus]
MEDLIPILSTVIAGVSTVIGFLISYKSKNSIESKLLSLKSNSKIIEFNRSNEALAEATATLVEAIKDVSEAAIQMGSLLVVKYADDNGTNVVAMELTNEQMTYLSQNPKILHKPKDLVLRLGEFDIPDSPINFSGILNTSNNKLQPTQKTRG